MTQSAFPLTGQLERIENRFLQVLLEQFDLRTHGSGFELSVEFSHKTPAIWSSDGKRYVQKNLIKNFARVRQGYQRELDQILVTKTAPPRRFSDPTFPFRYVSGGTLPVIRMADGKEYYCCFYRPQFPIGWNIANGGSDSRNELLNPILALERELREELVILNPKRDQLYTFSWDEAANLNVTEFAEARALLKQLSPSLDFAKYEQVIVPLMWLEGPDVLNVRFDGEEFSLIQNCFVNINALDFGIEVDRIAWMEVGEGVIICDGDTRKGRLKKQCSGGAMQGRLLNRIVGLFEIHEMHRKLDSHAQEFIPDLFFHGVNTYGQSEFKSFVKNVLRPTLNCDEYRDCANAKKMHQEFDLCPVTRRLLRRCVRSIDSWLRNKPKADVGNCEVFLCYGGRDKSLARSVFAQLTEQHVKTFFSEQIQPGAEWLRTVSSALSSAKVFLAVATDPRHLSTPLPMFECLTFYLRMAEDRRRKMIPLVVGGDPKRLPEVLKQRAAIVARKKSSALEQLKDLLHS